jgi:DNA (cytosine-5)-methyltransferase 1
VITVGSLFSGIGGLELGLEWAGMRVIWQAETDPYASRVLAKHWPDVPNLGDVTKVEWSDVERPELVCGGFPCQDISHAHTNGQRRGLDGEKSGLWGCFREAVERLGPRWVVVENVEAWRCWVPSVRGDLARLGYASVPLELSAGSFGAAHRRPRCFVVAHADGDGEPLLALHAEVGELRPLPVGSGDWGVPPPGGLRVADGVAHRVDRLRCLGNAVVPQVAQWIGERIIRAANA